MNPAIDKLRGTGILNAEPVAVQAVVTARVEGAVTNGRMQEITGAHPKDITDVLQALVRDGFLEQQNQRRWASYRLAGDSPQSSPQSLADSPHSADDSPHSLADSPQSAGDSPQSMAAVPDHLHELLPLAEPARSRRRLPAAKMRSVIEQLCMGRWLTTSEIAILLSREAEKLQSRFLTAMVREGRLKHRYPDVPNRPDQAYRTVSPTE